MSLIQDDSLGDLGYMSDNNCVQNSSSQSSKITSSDNVTTSDNTKKSPHQTASNKNTSSELNNKNSSQDKLRRPSLTDEHRRQKAALHLQDDGWGSRGGAPIQRWIIVMLIFSPVVVLGCTALIVVTTLPYVSHLHQEPSKPKKDDTNAVSGVYDAGEDIFVKFVTGVSVAVFMLVALLLLVIIVCVVQQRKASNYGIDDGLLSGLTHGDIVTLTKMHKERGEYRIDLSSGELNTAIDPVDKEVYCSNIKRESEASVTSDDGVGEDKRQSGTEVCVRSHTKNDAEVSGDVDWRSSTRNDSYKRAMKSKTFSEYLNRPESTLFDVNKYLKEQHEKNEPEKASEFTNLNKSLVSSQRENLKESVTSEEGSQPSSPSSLVANASSVLVSSEVTSYGSTLGRSRLLSSVDDDGYHFDNIGFCADLQEEDNNGVYKNDDCEEIKEEDEDSQDDLMDKNIRDAVDRLEKDLQRSPEFGSPPASGSGASNTSSRSKDGGVMLRRTSSDKGVVRQSSFQELPKQASFDKYLSLVRLDSTTSLSPVTEEAQIKSEGEQMPTDNQSEIKRQGVFLDK